MRELFVYYRVAAADAPAAWQAVQLMQDRLRVEFPGLVARLLVRRDGSEAIQTWMETYARPDEGGIDAGLVAAIASGASHVACLVEGPRHVEAFDVAAPA